MTEPMVSVVRCDSYELEHVRRAVLAALAPLGGIERFVRPGMKVLLKPNLLSAAAPERAVTTHPAVMEAVASLVKEAGGEVWIGDSPAGPIADNPRVWRASGALAVAERTASRLVPFERATWRSLRGKDYFLAPPLFDADLVVDLPKLKTHNFALYTGAVKNLFGSVPGTRKTELHYHAPGIADFGHVLLDILELVRPGLTIMDGILGMEGEGPGRSGTPHHYGCVLAATDPVALDAVATKAMGYRPGEVLHLVQAEERGLGVASPDRIRIVGEQDALEFGPLNLPRPRWYFNVPHWVAAPLRRAARKRPHVVAAMCIGCGKCVEVCPRQVITPGRPPSFALRNCIGCLCCAEVCPQGAIEVRRNLIARLLNVGR